MLRPLIALFAGLIFGLGLIVSGMVSPNKVLAFLDITGAAWDPSLALVLISAVAVSALGAAVGRRRKSPLLAATFSGPLRQALDGRLLLGTALFGVGWGLVGYCPGPAIAALALGAPKAVAFVVAMLAGMGLFTVFDLRTPARGGT
jgi:uncharacterized membrane protein YedE/YeeE